MKRFLALLLALTLVFALAACGGQAPSEGNTAPAQGTAPDGVAPTQPASPIPDRGTPPAADAAPPADPVTSAEPPASGDEAQAAPAPSASPAADAPASPAATAVPTPEPTPEPTPAPPAPAVTAADVFGKVAGAAGLSGFIDASATLEFEYDLSVDDLEDYGLYMPDMSAELQEVLVARVKPGKLADAQSACLARQQGMAEDAAFYQSTGTYVDGYKLTAQGDWILFYVGPNADRAVEAFLNAAN